MKGGKSSRCYTKKDIGICVFAIGLALCGCIGLEEPAGADGSRGELPVLRECPTNDALYAEMTWKEFRPFRVMVPSGVEVKCCHQEEGRMLMMVPDIENPVCARVYLDKSEDIIDGLIECYRTVACDSKKHTNVDWYSEAKYQDRRMLMDSTVFSDEVSVQCVCELDSGERLLFWTRSTPAVADSASENLWRVCRNIKFANKCLDAFNCMESDTPYVVTREWIWEVCSNLTIEDKLLDKFGGGKFDAASVSNGCALTKQEWEDPVADLGVFEWKSFEQYSVYLPADVEVECCSLDVYEFVFDLPGKHHYVTICAHEEDSDVLDDEVEFLRLNEVPRSSAAAGEKVKWSYANKFRQWTGIDWFIDKRLSDRRLVVEHRHQSEECEGVSCYCELDGGPVAVLYVRGSGAISCDEIDYFLQVCKKIEVKEKDEGADAEVETCENDR